MKRSAFIIVTFLFIALAAKGQSIEEIQTSKDYIWGTGNAATLKKADNEALAASSARSPQTYPPSSSN